MEQNNHRRVFVSIIVAIILIVVLAIVIDIYMAQTKQPIVVPVQQTSMMIELTPQQQAEKEAAIEEVSNQPKVTLTPAQASAKAATINRLQSEQ